MGSSLELGNSTTPVLSLGIRITVVFTCALSMVGALLIILSFACCRDLRTRGRQILVNISIMDMGVALFNLVGAAVYFDQFYDKKMCDNCSTYPSHYLAPVHCTRGNYSMPVMCPDSITIQYLCLLQAAFSLYFTYGSILWTNSLCLYLYFRIVYSGSSISRYFLYTSYPFCYGMPLLVTLWLVFTGRLGYSPYQSSGWCSIILMHPSTMKTDIYASVFGYNFWIVLTFVFVPVLSISIHFNVKYKVKNTAMYRRSDKLLLALSSLDYKFILIPLAFIFLRFWSFLEDVLHLYARIDKLQTWLSLMLTILGGIGDSGQGITNSLLFLFFTKKFRGTVRSFFCKFLLKRDHGFNIQESNWKVKVEAKKSLLDSTSSGDNISPHNFTYQSYENTTPVPLDINQLSDH